MSDKKTEALSSGTGSMPHGGIVVQNEQLSTALAEQAAFNRVHSSLKRGSYFLWVCVEEYAVAFGFGTGFCFYGASPSESASATCRVKCIACRAPTRRRIGEGKNGGNNGGVAEGSRANG